MSASGLHSLADFAAVSSTGSSYDDSQILVRFRDEYAQAPQPALEGTQIGAALGLVSGLHAVALNGVTVEEALAAYEASPAVLYAQPDYRIDLSVVSNDPGYTGQYLWGLENLGQDAGTVDADIDAPEAWNITTGSRDIIVAVIDSGVDYRHPDLAANIWTNAGEVAGDGVDNDRNGYVDDIHGYDFFNWDADPMDDNGHGTHVAGTIGAVGNNGRGVAGVSWGVQLMPLKFLGADGSGSLSGAIAALDYAVMMGAQISNNSWGGGSYVGSLYDSIQSALDANHLFVAAAGNENLNNDRYASYPANYALDNVISVAATDNRDQMASFSHWGATTVDIAAPGVDIASTTPDNTYSYMSGTSMATPHVSGAAALLWSSDPDLTLAEVKDRLLTGADFIGGIDNNSAKPTLTNGRLNAFNSLRPDLEWQSLVAPSSVYAGQSFSIQGAYRISGSPTAADITVSYYASSDSSVEGADDVLLGTQIVSAPDQQSVGMHALGSPAMSLLDPGTYYVYARIDSASAINEHREANNASLPSLLQVNALPKIAIEPGDFGVGAAIAPVSEGDMVALSAHIPVEITAATFEWQVSGGEFEIVGVAGGSTFRFRPIEGSLQPDPYTVTLNVLGSVDGLAPQSFADTISVFVENVAPTVDVLALPSPVVVGHVAEFSGTFTDPGRDSWSGTAQIVAPDGSIQDIVLVIDSDTKTYAFEHAFSEVGPHAITVTISDGDSPRSVSTDVDVAALPGDYNQDHSVDTADYVVWRKLQTLKAETNRDAEAVADGYSVWRANFGDSVTVTGGGSADIAPPIATSTAASRGETIASFGANDYQAAPSAHAPVSKNRSVAQHVRAVDPAHRDRPALRPVDFDLLPLAAHSRTEVEQPGFHYQARDAAFEMPDFWSDAFADVLDGVLKPRVN